MHVRLRRGRALVAGLAALALVATGCSGGAGADDEFVVVGTIAPLVDLIRQVAGEGAEVRGLVPPGENGHTYQPRPSDVKKLSGADVFIDNGLSLNTFLQGPASADLPFTAELVFLGEEAVVESELIGTPAGCHGGHCHGPVNAHLWPDPVYAADYVQRITEVLAGIDSANAETYQANGERLRATLAKLHDAIATATATVPEANRKLVVYHDAWAYFARRYGYQLVGAIQPANLAEPSAAEVRAMIDQIKAEAVPAFFGSEVFPSDVLEAVEEASGARYVDELSDDRLPGKPGDRLHSYPGMMVENARRIVGALGGDTTALDRFAEGLR